MGAITAVAATATTKRATRGELAGSRNAGSDAGSVVTLERIVFVPFEIAKADS